MLMIYPAMGESAKPKMTVSLQDQYYAPGDGILLGDDATIVFDFYYPLGEHLYLNIWSSFDIDGPSSSYGNEIDVILGCAGSSGSFDYDFGISYFNEPLLGHFDAEDVWHGYLTLSKEFKWVTCSLLYEFYHCDALTGGHIGGIGFSRDFSLSEKWTIPVSAELVYGDGTFGSDPGFFGRVKVGAEYALTENTSLGIQYSCWIFEGNDFRGDFADSISASISFQF